MNSELRPLPRSGRWLAIVVVGLLAIAVGAANGQPPRTQQFTYKQTSQRALVLIVHYPSAWAADDKRPAIVFFFGGGWKSGSVTQFQPQANYLAQRGMVAVRVDYRVRNRDQVTPIECVQDARSAMRWVRAHAGRLGIDPERIVSSGGSAGGHLAACVYFAAEVNDPADDLNVSPRPNAMVLYNPALDLTALDAERKKQLSAIINEDQQRKISPTLHLSRNVPPTLILDGTADFLYGQNKAFVNRGQALKAPVEVYWAEGATHGFFNRPPWLERTTKRVDEFLQRIGYLEATPHVALPTTPARQKKGKARPRQLKPREKIDGKTATANK